MPLTKQMITPCLWFDSQAEEAANFYCTVFKNSKVTQINRYPEAGQEIHKKPPGSVMVVAFELDGQSFTALNGGPNFKFDAAVSFQVLCETQNEIDYYWISLTSDGGQEGPCGWLKDKFGLSWQVVPTAIPRMMGDPDRRKSARVMNAFMKMKKLDLDTLERASMSAPHGGGSKFTPG
jgi:predicted 3-demethylubiquinone-9 3-methyltransferase (glyoxalase superfamily)